MFRPNFYNLQGLEEKERATAERKAQLKAAVDEGKKIPTDLKNDAIALQKDMDLDGMYLYWSLNLALIHSSRGITQVQEQLVCIRHRSLFRLPVFLTNL